MDALKETACTAIDQAQSELKDLSDIIWQHKELSYQEHKSHAALTQFLEDKGFLVERHHKLDTAFVATWSSGTHSESQEKASRDNRPHVALLCEYDALPEIGHACGHNLIAEIGVAAGLGLRAALADAGDGSGCIGQFSIIGTPAEEGGGGKIELIKAGVFDDVDIAMMSHPAPFTDARPIFLGGKRFVANFQGRPSHAAGYPWDGVNALDAAVLAYVNISALRQQLKPLWRVHAIITKGGTRTNIIPAEAQLSLQVRAPIDSEVTMLEAKVKACVMAAATASSCSVEIVDAPNPYECLITNETLARLYETNASQVGVAFASAHQQTTKQVLGSTDMGNLSHVIPCLHPTYAITAEGPNHTAEFAEAAKLASAQAPSLAQAKALSMVALDIFQKPELMNSIKQDFQNDLKHVQ